VYLALSPLSVTLHKNDCGSLVHHSMCSPPLDESCLSFHASFLYAGIFLFGCVGHTSFKLSMVLSLNFGCDYHTSIGFFSIKHGA
jgi:hypothetical protein